jgi:hypothetical protein
MAHPIRMFIWALTPAATILVNPNPPVFASVINSQVTGADLAGLVMTATYNGPVSPIVITSVWTPTGLTSGAAGNSAVSVSVAGNASDSLAWHYSSTFLSPLVSLDLDGSDAGIYFDRAHSGQGTPGSGPGADISFGPLFPPGIDSQFVVTYSRAVSLNGAPPQNDLYAKLTINFGNFLPQDFTFTQPVDRNVTPEPKSSWLILTGITVIVLTCSRKASTSNNQS